MKTLIIYNSFHHHNTEKIAKTMAEVLNAKLAKPENIDLKIINEYDLIGFGSGIYFSMHHESLFNILDKMPKMTNKKAFIFATSGSWHIKYFNDFNAPLRKKLESKGFDIIGTFSCRGYDTIGPLKLVGGLHRGRPNEEDIQKAKEFASNLI
jgi:flavodoxin